MSEEFIRNLLGYGGEVEIIAPLSLRKQVHERIQKMNDIYMLLETMKKKDKTTRRIKEKRKSR